MNNRSMDIENKLKKFLCEHKREWLIICGIQTTSYSEMLKILQILRDKKLYELEAMMVWKMEYLALD